MTLRKIVQQLEKTLLHDGPMQHGLSEDELDELLGELTESLSADQDDYLFAVTQNDEHVAMLLIEKSGQVHVNEQAREKLRALWPVAYESNMKQFIPLFAKELQAGEIAISGVKTVKS